MPSVRLKKVCGAKAQREWTVFAVCGEYSFGMTLAMGRSVSDPGE